FGEKTAVRGKWLAGPGADFFETAMPALATLQLIAEDLGALTPEILALRDRFGFPGMRVLQFSFGIGAESERPHNWPHRCIAYTGTHDNDTTVGWFRKTKPDERKFVRRYLASDGKEIHCDMIRALMQSPVDTVIRPAQDLLGLDSSARMNIPGTPTG